VRKELWNEKAACKILVKLTVRPRFFAQLLSAYYFGFVIFWRKDLCAKAAHKMLVKLTPGVGGMIQTHDAENYELIVVPGNPY
jgi:hypothetical protein